eukprot:Em0012g275a
MPEVFNVVLVVQAINAEHIAEEVVWIFVQSIEKFNKSLKAMLWMVAVERHLNWDSWLPFLLKTHWISLFELLYGQAVQEPLELLKDIMEPKKCSDNAVALQEKLASMAN